MRWALGGTWRKIRPNTPHLRVNQSMVVCFYDSLFWHCSGLIELTLPTVGLAVSGQEVPRARSVSAHTLTCIHKHCIARTAPPKLLPHTHT